MQELYVTIDQYDFEWCDCDDCGPVRYLGERINEGHVSIDFDDLLWRWKITLNGVDVTRRCTDALAGPHGWVILLHDPADACEASGRKHACRELYMGDVRVSLTQPVPSAVS